MPGLLPCSWAVRHAHNVPASGQSWSRCACRCRGAHCDPCPNPAASSASGSFCRYRQAAPPVPSCYYYAPAAARPRRFRRPRPHRRKHRHLRHHRRYPRAVAAAAGYLRCPRHYFHRQDYLRYPARFLLRFGYRPVAPAPRAVALAAYAYGAAARTALPPPRPSAARKCAPPGRR